MLWQKDFVDRCVLNSKVWIDAGILVVEEESQADIGSDSPQIDKDSQSMKTESATDTREASTSTLGKQIEGALTTDSLPSSQGSGSKEMTESKAAPPQPLPHESTAKYVALQVKFLHKLIQEWFAAKYLALLFWGYKSTESHCKYQLFREHLANIDPADLHYVLRFTCHICLPSFHFIVSHLMREFKSADGQIPDYIINCICLCFAEYDGYRGHRVKDIVTEICGTELITISSEDSRLLLRAKVSMLTFASKSKVR